MEQSKKIYFDSTLYVDSKIKDKNYIHSNNLIVGTNNSSPPNIFKSILKFNSNNWEFTHIDSIYLFIFLEKIDFKYSYNGNISILCYPEDVDSTDSLEDSSKLNFSKRLNLTFPPKAIERYIKIDITNVFTSIYSLNKVYNLVLEPYFSPDNENPTSIIEFLSNNSKMPPYLIINGTLMEKSFDESLKQDIINLKSNCYNFLDEIKSLNNNSLGEISSKIQYIESFNKDLLNNNNNITEILNSEIMSKNEFYEFMKKFDSNNDLVTTLNENIINNNSLISSLKKIIEKNSIDINKISSQLNNNIISIDKLNTKVKDIDSTTSSLNENINKNNEFINEFSEKLNNNNISIDKLNTKVKDIDSTTSSLTESINKFSEQLNNNNLSINNLISIIKNTDSTISSLTTNINNIDNFIEILIKELNNIKLSINTLNTKLLNNDSIIACLDDCSNNTLDMSKEIKNLNNCIITLNNNVKTDKSILKDLNESIDEILKFTENITLTSLY